MKYSTMSHRVLAGIGALLLSLTVLGLAGEARASLIVDDFSDANVAVWPVVHQTVDIGAGERILETGLTGVFGGTRETYLGATFIGHVGLDRVGLQVFTDGASILDYESSARATGHVTLNYGSAVAGGEAFHIDLSIAEGIEIELIDYDAPGGNLLEYQVHVFSGLQSAVFAGSTSQTGPQVLSLELTGDLLTDVTGLRVQFFPFKAADFQIEEIRVPIIVGVPEPATLGCLVFGLGVFYRRVLRRKAAAGGNHES